MRGMVFQLAILFSAYQMKNVKAALEECTFGYFRCDDNSKCVSDQQLCDYKRDCDDLSDERLAMCKIFHKYKTGDRHNICHLPGEIYYVTNCISISYVCTGDSLSGDYRILCNELSGGLKPSEEFSALRNEQASLEKFFSSLVASYNKTDWTKMSNDCPPLYVKVDDKCVALFLTAKVTWTEAKHFCESISGKLAIIKTMIDYEALLRHLKSNDIATSFWIGGLYRFRYWRWLDSTEIEMGARFWSIYYLGECKMRKNSDHCFVYDISPRENTDGYCLSMDYEFHYYFSDNSCFEKRNPLCYLNE